MQDPDEDEYEAWLDKMEAIQKHRQTLLREGCKKYSTQPFQNIDKFAENRDNMLTLYFNDDYRVIYNHVAKGASQLWTHYLYDSPETAKLTSTAFKSHINKNRRLSEVSLDGRINRLDKYVKFIFVRDPLARLVSGFQDTLVKNPVVRTQKLIKRFLKYHKINRAKYSDVTYTDFLKFIVSYVGRNEGLKRSTFWGSYLDTNQVCQIDHDFIGHIETMEEDSKYLIYHVLRIKRENEATVLKPRQVGITDSRNDLLQKMYSSVPQKTMKTLLEYYEADFRLFGYNMTTF